MKPVRGGGNRPFCNNSTATQQWKVGAGEVARRRAVKRTDESYSKLIHSLRGAITSSRESINPEDIGILSRKLYTAFEALPAKYKRINLKNRTRILREAEFKPDPSAAGASESSGLVSAVHTAESA